jgi:hypothetical protein
MAYREKTNFLGLLVDCLYSLGLKFEAPSASHTCNK